LSSLARSFDLAAEEYEQGRPGWPDEMLDLLPLPAEATVLDLGAGTGKLTRTLLRRYADVIAVEPLPGMRGILERELPDVVALEGSAKAIPLDDASVDGVFCGQSAHWFANDDAVAEIGRVVRPGGILVAAWNRPDPDRPSPLPEAYSRRIAELRPPLPQEHVWSGAVERGPFEPVHEAVVANEHVGDSATILRSAFSVSWIASRDDRDAIAVELTELLPPGEYRIPLRTEIVWAVRRR
jgi:SAM-dependent methyltransferase